MTSNPKPDRIGKVCNWILGILYVPWSFMSFLMMMVSEAAMGANNPVFITLIDVICGIFFINAFLCLFAVPVAVLLKRKGYSLLSLCISFLPLVLSLLNFGLLAITDLIPAVI